jgi:membrane-associated phospholipid phosphatase
LVAGGVGAGIGLTIAFDKDIQQAVQRARNGTIDSVFNAVQPFGAEYSFAVLGAFYVGGEIFRDPRAKSVALDGLSAGIIASGLVTTPLKYVFGRARPEAGRGAYDFQPFSGQDSFPSGHATQAYAVATVIAEHYDSLWIKLGSYGLASMVGYARLNNNAHWASDVVAGAAIGIFVGHVVVHFNQGHRNISLQPVIGPNTQGAQISLSF